MPDDCRVKRSFSNHPKRVKLQRRLGRDAVLALVELWTFAAESRPTGDLTGLTAEDMAIAAGYEGDAERWIDELVDVGFLDRDELGLRIHDWADHNHFAFTSPERSERSRKAARARWGIPETDASRMRAAMPDASGRNAPSGRSGRSGRSDLPAGAGGHRAGSNGKADQQAALPLTPPAAPATTRPRSSKAPAAEPLPWTVAELILAFKRGAGDRFVDDFDRKLAKPLTELIRRLHEAGKNLTDVEAAGRYVSTWSHPVSAFWLARDGALWDAIAKARGGAPAPTTRGGGGRDDFEDLQVLTGRR